jgi:hypothetical protein
MPWASQPPSQYPQQEVVLMLVAQLVALEAARNVRVLVNEVVLPKVVEA